MKDQTRGDSRYENTADFNFLYVVESGFLCLMDALSCVWIHIPFTFGQISLRNQNVLDDLHEVYLMLLVRIWICIDLTCIDF